MICLLVGRRMQNVATGERPCEGAGEVTAVTGVQPFAAEAHLREDTYTRELFSFYSCRSCPRPRV